MAVYACGCGNFGIAVIGAFTTTDTGWLCQESSLLESQAAIQLRHTNSPRDH